MPPLKVTHVVQSSGFCGPASLQIALSYFGKNHTEAELGELSGATPEIGTEHEGMIAAAQKLGATVFVKERAMLADLRYFVHEEKLPVIVGWFAHDGDHYSVVTGVTDTDVVLSDPADDESEMRVSLERFPHLWFDFTGAQSEHTCWGWLMVMSFEKRDFKIEGGKYF